MAVSLGCFLASSLMMFFIPETLNWKHENSTALSDPVDTTEGESHDDFNQQSFPYKIVEGTRIMFDEVRHIFASPPVATLAATFLVNSLGAFAVNLLLQYASEKFHWSYAKAISHA